jgi:hypothetical protein
MVDNGFSGIKSTLFVIIYVNIAEPKYQKIINMEVLFEILKYIVPALIVFLTVVVMLRAWSRNEDKRRKSEFNMHMSDDILPVRLQAYERSILLLERISPDSMIMRLSRNDFTARQLLQELLTSITSEFDHNIAQQTYLSTEAWEKMKSAKNQVINLINDTAKEVKPDAPGPTLGKLILERLTELKNPPSQVAIDYLKQEVKTLFL